jgi:hypothetical protein
MVTISPIFTVAVALWIKVNEDPEFDEPSR